MALRVPMDKGIEGRKHLTADWTKDGEQLDEVIYGGGWDENTDLTEGRDFDCDVVFVRVDSSGEAQDVDDLIYFNHPNAKRAVREARARGEDVSKRRPPFFSNDGTIWHSGDNLTGVGDGLDELVKVLLTKQDPRYTEMDVVFNIHQGKTRDQTFAHMDNCYFEIQGGSGLTIPRFDLTHDAKIRNSTCVLAARGTKSRGLWATEAIGQPFAGGIQEYFATRAIEIEDPNFVP